MQRNIEEITSELIGLPKRERLEIVRFLLSLDDHSSDSNDVESSWAKEITARAQAVENGAAEAIDFDAALKNIAKRFAS